MGVYGADLGEVGGGCVADDICSHLFALENVQCFLLLGRSNCQLVMAN